jgi:hypothetical protein
LAEKLASNYVETWKFLWQEDSRVRECFRFEGKDYKNNKPCTMHL